MRSMKVRSQQTHDGGHRGQIRAAQLAICQCKRRLLVQLTVNFHGPGLSLLITLSLR